jgi:hypothetical protein
MRTPRRYFLPESVREALEAIFEQSIAAVEIIEYSRYARLHAFARATTRPNRILLASSGEAFAADPELLLHEFFHVLCQWRPRQLTRTRYVLESARRGYTGNRFELEAREFAQTHAARLRALTEGARVRPARP